MEFFTPGTTVSRGHMGSHSLIQEDTSWTFARHHCCLQVQGTVTSLSVSKSLCLAPTPYLWPLLLWG